jgi:hypothetical protein
MMTKEEKRAMCAGCDMDFYNGKNSFDIDTCWSLEKAKVVRRKKVHVDQVPPWKQKPIKTLSCYHCRRYVFVGPEEEY